MAAKLPVSRWQRDLSDSTVLRNMGAALGHCLVAYESTLKGLSRLEVNEAVITADLLDRWEVLAEAVQTVMRRYGIPDPYEKLKALTRGQAVTPEVLQEFISTLEIPAAEKERLASLTPEAYIGLAADLANDV